jgi:hypothetical protein
MNPSLNGQCQSFIHQEHCTSTGKIALSPLTTTKPITAMSRGNQREIDREKARKREAAKNGGNQREGTPAGRNEDDSQKLKAKVEAKKAKQAAEAEAAVSQEGSNPKAPVVRKKVAKKTANLDDLLDVGLKTGGKKTRGK